MFLLEKICFEKNAAAYLSIMLPSIIWSRCQVCWVKFKLRSVIRFASYSSSTVNPRCRTFHRFTVSKNECAMPKKDVTWIVCLMKNKNSQDAVGIWNLDTFGFGIVKKRLVCKWSIFQMGSKIWKLDHLKSEQMAAILSKTI